MPDTPDIPDPSPALVAKEVSSIIAEYGPIEGPEDLDRLARGSDGNPNSYDGGPVLARRVAAELRRLAQELRDRRGGTLLQ